MKHGIVWWLFVGWWWYLCVAWWLYPIKWFLQKSSNAPSNIDDYDRHQLIREAAEYIIDFLEKSNDGTALQVDVKKKSFRSVGTIF